MLTEEDLIKNDKIIKILEDTSNKTKTVEELAIMILEIFGVENHKNKLKMLESTKEYVQKIRNLDSENI